MVTSPKKPRLIIGISGASGAVYGIHLLKILKEKELAETHLVISKGAEMVIKYETNFKLSEVKNLADHVYNFENTAATIASGSFLTDGMIIAPCSIRTMSEISSGVTSNLLTRAADVVLKERRRLILMVRETPLHTGHLRTMTNLSEIGAIIAPAMPAMYNCPQTINDLVDHSVGRILDLVGIHIEDVKRWDGKKRSAITE